LAFSDSSLTNLTNSSFTRLGRLSILQAEMAYIHDLEG
jgi:hypothetical protein